MLLDPINIKSNLRDYSVEFVDMNLLDREMRSDNTVIVIDSKVKNIYFPFLSGENVIEIDCNETIKDISVVTTILQAFDDLRVNSNSKVLVIGGGVLQDCVGFCCSIFKRGIDYVLVPTTMLSQADSCIGGKTGINFKNKKNLLGTFYPPKRILVCFDFLLSLPVPEILSGIGEIYKFHVLQGKISEFSSDFNDPVLWEKYIHDGLKYKTSILHLDEFDKKERKYLNFGHTFGHAMESVSGYTIPHGVAVAIGVLVAMEISSVVLGKTNDHDQIIESGKRLVLSNGCVKRECFDFGLLLPIIKSDKKNDGQIKMVLIGDNGPVLKAIDSLEMMSDCCSKVYESF